MSHRNDDFISESHSLKKMESKHQLPEKEFAKKAEKEGKKEINQPGKDTKNKNSTKSTI